MKVRVEMSYAQKYGTGYDNRHQPAVEQLQSGCVISLQSSGTFRLPGLLSIQWHVQAQALTSGVASDATLKISLGDKFLAPGINKQANQVRAHVVAGKVSQCFGQMTFIEVDLLIV
jgi:hypothetical protein